MMFEEYRKRIESARNEQELNDLVELAAFEDGISNEQYEELYRIGLDRYWKLVD